MDDEITIRQATVADVLDLVRLRRMMFEAMGYTDPAQMSASDVACERYFTEAIPTGQFYGWLAVAPDGAAVGSGGVVIDQHPPGPRNLTGQIGYIMSLVTDPRYRRRGIARCVMQVMLDWLAAQNIQVAALHATEIGRPLYEELGFSSTNEMRMRLKG